MSKVGVYLKSEIAWLNPSGSLYETDAVHDETERKCDRMGMTSKVLMDSL